MSHEPNQAIESFFYERWSNKSYAETPVSSQILMELVEAARFAPSSFNEQPWRFHFAGADGEATTRATWNDALNQANQMWAKNAPILGFIVANTTFKHNGKPNRHAYFDTGAAANQLLLQAHLKGMTGRMMGGFVADVARSKLALSPGDEIVCAIALGYPGTGDELPEEIAVKNAPSSREPSQSRLKIYR